VTSELRAQPGEARPGEAWVRDDGREADGGQEAPVAHPGRHRRAPEARSSYREVFAIGEFRALWSAQVLSFAGDQFAQVAIAILVYGRTHSPFLTALAYALTYLPPIAVLDPHKTLSIDAATFAVSAVILAAGVRSRPAPARPGGTRASLWSVSADGVRIVFGSRLLLTLLLFGWLAGFYIVPEGLAAPYARSLRGNTLTVGLLMAAVPLGMVIGAFLLGRVAAPSARIRMMGWLVVLSCAPLIGSAWSPPLWAVLALRTLAGAGGAYQLAAAAAFVQALRPDTRARAFGVAQSGLYAVQGLGILAGGAVAQLIGAPLAVGLAGLVGLTAATMLATSWTHLRGRLIQARPNGPESL
jgi:Major Facilitator Superfamily